MQTLCVWHWIKINSHVHISSISGNISILAGKNVNWTQLYTKQKPIKFIECRDEDYLQCTLYIDIRHYTYSNDRNNRTTLSNENDLIKSILVAVAYMLEKRWFCQFQQFYHLLNWKYMSLTCASAHWIVMSKNVVRANSVGTKFELHKCSIYLYFLIYFWLRVTVSSIKFEFSSCVIMTIEQSFAMSSYILIT